MGLYNFQPRFVPRIEIGLIHPDDPRAGFEHNTFPEVA